MSAKWLFKTEPDDYSFDALVRDKRARWDGVTNATALIHLRNVRKGDSILIYHTGNERAIVGIARAAGDSLPDPKVRNPKIVAVEIVPERRLSRPVSLDEIKSRALFAQWELVRIGRLGVMPVPDPIWSEILRMEGSGASKPSRGRPR